MALGFLDLPPEIRNQIYHLALVREAGAKIELWPDLYSELEYLRGLYTLPIPRGTASEKQAVLAKYYPGLLFVRKELAVGLLATCRQVHDEAAGLFWSGNHFSFSGHLGWHMLLRFLSSISKDGKIHMRCLSVVAPFFSVISHVSHHSDQLLDEQDIYTAEIRLAKVDPDPSVWCTIPVGGCCEMLRTFPKIKTLHLVVPKGRCMQYTATSEENFLRLRRLKTSLSLEIAGILLTEWDTLEHFSRSDALTLATVSIIEISDPIPFPHQHPYMHIRRGGTIKAVSRAVDGLNVYRHLLKVDEVVGLKAQGRGIQDLYDPECEDIYDVIEG